ncbi:tyrosine-type recombinase/integrase [Pseudodesulfovibrio senegalensis]|uniref:Tyrosine-type recombinase/integrase n=1 Tax=Pseudodesulfovibrio senegalensis TaxID=1721087 RepID=A0A6N6MZ40_9BACT|nr:site-specific integrase [Pseudodesulfovibrio senegalensis]KAB1440340.1 tyrosine-type recombinase/integrase [Pseudodesulfovibrio senegalensis]
MAIKELKGRAKPFRVYWRNPYTKKIQTAHFTELRDAREHDSQIKHWLEFEPERFAPEEEVQASGQDLTVEGIVWAYLKDRQLKPKSLRDTIYHLKKVLPIVGMVQVSDLKKAHMRTLVSELRDQGLKQNGINRKVSIIKAALNWAEAQELIELNPVRNFSCPRGVDEKIPPPSPEELQTMISVASPHIQRVIVLGLSFGLRIGSSELLQLTWEDVDMVRWRLRVWSADKNLAKPWRDLDIKTNLQTVISEWHEQDKKIGAQHVIHWKGKPVSAIKSAWKATLRRAGITRRIRPYDLRHAHATEVLAAGADTKAVAENMGHNDTTMILKHYQHVLVKQRKEALAVTPDLVIQHGNTGQGVSGSFCITNQKKIQ